MYQGVSIGVVIPARNEAEHLGGVLSGIPSFVDKVVVVDDGSSDGTGELAGDADVVRLEGEGVGSAIDHGHRRLLDVMDSNFISVVMAGDGQMDPDDMESLIAPIINHQSHHVKGERLDRVPMAERIFAVLL